MELEGFPSMEDKGLQFGGAFGRHSEPSTPTQYGAIRTVRTQGLFSYREDYRPSSGPSSPQPEPWLVEPSLESAETGRVSPIRRDGSWFMQLLHNETKRLEGWCKEMEREAEEHDLSEESECPEGNYFLFIAGAAFVEWGQCFHDMCLMINLLIFSEKKKVILLTNQWLLYMTKKKQQILTFKKMKPENVCTWKY